MRDATAAPDRYWRPTQTHDGHRRPLIRALVLVVVLLGVALPVAGQRAGSAALTVPILTIDGPIPTVMARHVSGAIGDAGPDAAAIVLDVATAHHRPIAPLRDALAASDAITGDRAEAQGRDDAGAPDPATALSAPNALTATVGDVAVPLATAASIPLTLGERIRALLADPTFAYLLLCFGVIGLMLELSAPGITVAGVGGGGALVAAAVLLSGMPLNGTGVALILAGLVLLVIDLFVPSLGLLSIGGLSSFVIGSYVLFDGGGAGHGVNPVAIWSITGCLIVFLLAVGGSGLTMLGRRPASGREAIVGQIGEVRATLAPEGLVFVDGEIWRAHAMTLHRTAAAPIMPAGTLVRVTSVDGLMLEVRAATDAEIRQANHAAARVNQGSRRHVVAADRHRQVGPRS